MKTTTRRRPATMEPHPMNLGGSGLLRYTIFPSELGWFGLAGRSERIERLVYGHATSEAARKALAHDEKRTGYLRDAARDDLWFGDFVERLQAYAGGARDDFRDVQIDYGARSPFHVAVSEWCRRIPPGITVSYGHLAAAAGFPNAARAVGTVMRTNRTPLVVPCHRVVAGSGKLGGYSTAGGLKTKRRLLDMEMHSWISEAVRQVVEV